MNLTSIREPRKILIKHFLDSLAILPWLPEGSRILDIGTGAGFPGMVVKLTRLTWPVTLVEATGKKVGFLEHARRVLQLEACEILHRRLEGGEEDLRGRFEVVVSRGVESPASLVRRAAGYLRPGGRIIAMSGKADLSANLRTGTGREAGACRLEQVDRFDLPEKVGTRHLLLFRCEQADVPRGT